MSRSCRTAAVAVPVPRFAIITAKSPLPNFQICPVKLQTEFKVTVRCIPHDTELRGQPGTNCIYTGKPALGRVIFAKSY
jgi:hypothetical protein